MRDAMNLSISVVETPVQTASTFVRRKCQDTATAGAKHPEHLAKAKPPNRRRYVLEHVEAYNDVVRCAWEGQVICGAVDLVQQL
jgi:hypothetical protein